MNQDGAQSNDPLLQTILKTAIKSIPMLTQENFSLWRNQVENMLDIQGTRSALCSEDALLSMKEKIYIRSTLTSKLDPSVHANVITFENEKDAKLIWKAIIKHFASSESSN